MLKMWKIKSQEMEITQAIKSGNKINALFSNKDNVGGIRTAQAMGWLEPISKGGK